jgi:outer membrane receptor protein involved in Fe transport
MATQHPQQHKKRIVQAVCLAMPLFAAGMVQAEEATEGSQLSEVIVTTDKSNSIGRAYSASEGFVTAEQLENRPLLRPAEVLETVPGLTVTQHSGDGKANQYFLRGFNLDHGSDFATSVHGAPVNMASHAHGQGYMDLNFLIPELVGGLRYNKGVYAAEDGDFGSTGSARIDYRRSLEAPYLDLTVGEHNYRRALAAGSQEWNGLQLLGALEIAGNDGPWEQPENLRKANAALRASSGTADNGYSLALLAYRGTWKATEHVPERAIDSGEIGRFGNLLPNDGGETHRISLTGEWASTGNDSAWRANAWIVDYALNLFSSPSGFINGPQGDQHEQADDRTLFGGQLERRWFLGDNWRDTEISLGTQLRHDRIGTVGLYDTVDRLRTHTVREDRVNQTSTALYLQADTEWLPGVRSTAGLRYDHIRANVDPTGGDFNQTNGGSASDNQLSPKLSLAWRVLPKLDLYANWGRGFHSNDARGATTRTNPLDGSVMDAVPLISTTTGSEIGLRANPWKHWESTLSFWRTKMDSELVFVGDEGVTEPRGSSHRQGIEWSNHLAPWPNLQIDADVAVSKARFDEAVNGGKRVPNAIPVSASIAATYDGGDRWFGGLRLRYIGSYDLEETGSEKSNAFLTANAKLGYRLDKQWQFSLDVLNLFDRKANDIEYWGGACSAADGPGCNGGEGIDGRLVHPLEPRTLRVGLRYTFQK